MTPELALRAERAVADLESAAAYVRGNYFQAVIERAVTAAVTAAGGPWLDRQAAAAHARCSVGEIDRAADAGAFVRYHRGGTPMFKREELNTAIETGKWPKRAQPK